MQTKIPLSESSPLLSSAEKSLPLAVLSAQSRFTPEEYKALMRGLLGMSATAVTWSLDAAGLIPVQPNLAWALLFPTAMTVVSIAAGWPYFRGGADNFWQLCHARMPHLDMNTLVTLSSLGLLIYYPLCFYGVFPEKHLDYHALFMTLSALGLSEFAKLRINNYIQGETQNALTILENLRVLSATRCLQNDQADVLTSEIKVGDRVYVARDAVIPVDGRLQTGTNILDGTLISGESKPQFMEQDSLAYAGTRNVGDPVIVEAICNGGESYLDRLIDDATKVRGKSDSETTNFINHVIAAFVPFTLGISAVALIAWWTLRNLDAGFANMNNVLLGACPCTLGIANQVPWSIAKWVSLKHGVLIQRNRAVELLPQIKQFAFDKTGTLTELTISDFKIFENDNVLTTSELLNLIFAAQQQRLKENSHDIYADLLFKYIKRHEHYQPAAAAASEIIRNSANGIEIRQEGRTLAMGNAAFLEDIESLPDIDNTATHIWIAVNGEIAAVFSLQHALNPDAKPVIDYLRQRGASIILLTGDTDAATKPIAERLGIDYKAGLKPHQKVDHIKLLRAKGLVGYVGDGLNDVPAMQAADLSIVVSRHALGSSQADMVVNELRQIGSLPPVCHRIRMNHIQGVSFSLLYNIVMIGLSALIFPVYDKTMDPMVPGIAMAGSSLLVLAWAAMLVPQLNKQWNNNKSPANSRERFFGGQATEVVIDVGEYDEQANRIQSVREMSGLSTAPS